LAGIRAQGRSLNPGRYVDVAERPDDGVDFGERLGELSTGLERLNATAHALEEGISMDVRRLVGGIDRAAG